MLANLSGLSCLIHNDWYYINYYQYIQIIIHNFFKNVIISSTFYDSILTTMTKSWSFYNFMDKYNMKHL